MKKVLLATSALTLLGGAAMAEVSVSGSARTGVVNTGGVTAMSTRTRFNLRGSGTTDNGLTFGSFVRIQTTTAAAGTVSGGEVTISNGTITLAVGNTNSAVAQTANIFQVNGCGIGYGPTIGCANVVTGFNNASFSSGGAGNNVARVDFSLGNINISASSAPAGGNGAELALNAALGAVNIGLGHDGGAGAAGGNTLTVNGELGGGSVGAGWHRTNAGVTNWNIVGQWSVGAGAIGGFYGNHGGAARYGIEYEQSLGGGAKASIAWASVAGVATTTAGLNFSF